MQRLAVFATCAFATLGQPACGLDWHPDYDEQAQHQINLLPYQELHLEVGIL